MYDGPVKGMPIMRTLYLSPLSVSTPCFIATNSAPKTEVSMVDCFFEIQIIGDKLTRRSRTGFLIFCNLAPIIWISKKQSTIETSVFGAEFVAMKHGVETLRGLRYKVRMMGIPLTGPSYIYGDNKSQVTNSSRPESTLKKKCNSICYHAIRESVAMGESLITHIKTDDNLSDFLTKTTSGAKRRKLVSGVVHDIYDDFPKQ